MPGYRFQYQVPPTSAPRSTMRMLSTPRSRSRAAVSSAEKPPPMNSTSTSSAIGARAREVGRVLRRAVRPVTEPQVARLGELGLDLVVIGLRRRRGLAHIIRHAGPP